MTSPAITAAASSTRTEMDVRRAREAQKRLTAIGRMYLIEVAHRGGSYFTESDRIPRGKDWSVTDGLALLQQEDDAVAIWELNPSEGGMRDVSEDMARLWLAEILTDSATDFDPQDATTWPQFVARHLTNDEALREWEEARGHQVAAQ